MPLIKNTIQNVQTSVKLKETRALFVSENKNVKVIEVNIQST